MSISAHCQFGFCIGKALAPVFINESTINDAAELDVGMVANNHIYFRVFVLIFIDCIGKVDQWAEWSAVDIKPGKAHMRDHNNNIGASILRCSACFERSFDRVGWGHGPK